ncbi:MAG: hypothetical protein IJT91_04645 [Clostridia bacterium]|nr:hypothetical protein [Clostridia bacterium]
METYESEYTFIFNSLPKNTAELEATPESSFDTPFKTAALAIAALCGYENDPDSANAMLDVLKGPDSLSVYEKQFIRDRLAGKYYVPFSFFAGAVPENNYTPDQPYTITVYANPYSFQNENWATLYVKSGGADSQRPLRLRKKPSTEQWFLVEIQCLSDIRIPVESDPWA